MTTEQIAKQAMMQDALTYCIQSGNRHLPLRYAWRIGGATAVVRVLLGRLRAVLHD